MLFCVVAGTFVMATTLPGEPSSFCVPLHWGADLAQWEGGGGAGLRLEWQQHQHGCQKRAIYCKTPSIEVCISILPLGTMFLYWFSPYHFFFFFLPFYVCILLLIWFLTCGHCTQKWRQMNMTLQGWSLSHLNDWRNYDILICMRSKLKKKKKNLPEASYYS